MTNSSVVSHDLYAKKENTHGEVLSGLRSPNKKIPAKYFYNEKGSELFEQITEQAEYYPTRTEISILQSYKEEIAETVGPVSSLIEYGSGSSRKIKTLLTSLHSLEEYIPIDISREFLYQSCSKLSMEFPDLQVKMVCADYMHPLNLPVDRFKRKVVFFPGSTIGNFEPDEVCEFLERTFQLLDSGDGFIIGVDLKKEPALLNAAYNDQNGVTAKFNLNILEHLNQELQADFKLDQFQHVAFYNEEKGRIEMHLESLCDQDIKIAQEVIHFQKQERIHTENSYKYDVKEFQQVIQSCGFTPVKAWTDRNNLFSVHYIEK